jgi:nitrous oxidase accessory protein
VGGLKPTGWLVLLAVGTWATGAATAGGWPAEPAVSAPASQESDPGAGFAARPRDVAPGELSQALAEAQDGDWLRLLAGTHHGAFRIDKRLRIDGADAAIIEGPGSGTVLVLAADGIELRHLEVRGAGSDLAMDDAVILLMQVRGVSVRDCVVRGAGFGIYLREGGSHRIVDNRIIGDSTLPTNRRGNGVHLFHAVENVVQGNTTVDVRDGVYLSFAHANEIRGNSGSGLRYGIHYMYSERNLLEENSFSEGIGGIALMYSLDNQFRGNVLAANRDFGILCLQLERSTLEGNTLRANGRGLVLQNSATNRLTGNNINNNGVGVYLTTGSEANLLSGNRFRQNLVHVFQDRAGSNSWSEARRGNYWGDYAGFDWNNDGVGDSPYRLQTAASALLAHQPSAHWFRMSPALALLDWWQARIGAADAGGLDRYPLMADPDAPGARPGR